MHRIFFNNFKPHAQRLAFWLQAIILVLASLTPLLLSNQASAYSQLTSRKATIGSSNASASTSYAFNFTTPSGGVAIQGIIFEFCTTPLGTCTKPTGLDVSFGTAQVNGTQTFTNATAFTEQTSSLGDCNIAGTSADTKYCVKRTDATNEAAGAKSITIDTITNPSVNGSVYIRISAYDNNTFTPGAANANIPFYGTVAAAIVSTLTVNGRVQERLQFCVSSIDDAAALPTDVAACSSIGTTVVDIGTVDNLSIARSPVDNNPPTSQGNDAYGIAMVNTNASNGLALTYYANLAGSGTNELRSFRVTGAACNGSQPNSSDQCFISASTAGEAFTAGTERFGEYIPCIDTTQGTTTNMGSVPAAYSGTDATTTSAADCENEAGVKFAWNDTGTATALASSSTVVDDEIVKIRFGATAAATTPTGAYTVVSTYIATPTF
jgi:hypothetical protein